MIVLYPFYINSELFNIQKKTLIQSLYSAPKKRENLFHRSKDEETGIEDEERGSHISDRGSTMSDTTSPYSIQQKDSHGDSLFFFFRTVFSEHEEGRRNTYDAGHGD